MISELSEEGIVFKTHDNRFVKIKKKMIDGIVIRTAVLGGLARASFFITSKPSEDIRHLTELHSAVPVKATRVTKIYEGREREVINENLDS